MTKLSEDYFKPSTSKSLSYKTKTECIKYWIDYEKIRTLAKRLDAIQNTAFNKYKRFETVY